MADDTPAADAPLGTMPDGSTIDTKDFASGPPGAGLRSVFESVARPDMNPETTAKVLDLADTTGQTPGFVETRLPEAELAARSKSLDAIWADIEAKRPNASRLLSDPRNMAIAHDDIPNIVGHESMIQEATTWAKTKAAHLELATLSQEYSQARYRELHGSGPEDAKFTDPMAALLSFRPTRLAAPALGINASDPAERVKQISARMEEIKKTLPPDAHISNDMVEAIPFLANLLTAGAGGATATGLLAGAAGLEGGPLAFLTGAGGAAIGGKVATADFFMKQGYVATYDRLSKERDENGKPIPEDLIRAAATVNGAVQAGLSAVEIGKLLPPGTAPALIKNLTKGGALRTFMTGLLGNSAHAAAAMANFSAADTYIDETTKNLAQHYTGAKFQHTTLTAALTDALHAGVSGAIVFSPLSALQPALGLRASLGEIDQARRTKQVLTDLLEAKKDSKLNARLPDLYTKFNGDVMRDTPQANVLVDREAAERLFQKDNIDPAKQFAAMGLTAEYELSKKTGEPISIPTEKWLSDAVPSQLPNQLLDDTKFAADHKTVNQIRTVIMEQQGKLEEQAKRMEETQKEAAALVEKDPAVQAVHSQIYEDARARLDGKVPDTLTALQNRSAWLDANAKIVADHYVVEAGRRKAGDPLALYNKEAPKVFGPQDGETFGEPFGDGLQQQATSAEAGAANKSPDSSLAAPRWLRPEQASASPEPGSFPEPPARTYSSQPGDRFPDSSRLVSSPYSNRIVEEGGGVKLKVGEEAWNASAAETNPKLMQEIGREIVARKLDAADALDFKAPLIRQIGIVGKSEMEAVLDTLKALPVETIAPEAARELQAYMIDAAERYHLGTGDNMIPKDALDAIDALGARAESGKRLEQAAFHGSPHEFDEFSLHKIGTGEGAQAFGWGLYFTDEKKIAQNYRENLSKDSSVPTDLEVRNPSTGTWQKVGRGGKPEPGVTPALVHAAQLVYHDGVRNARKWARQWLKEAEGAEGVTSAISRDPSRGPEYYKSMISYLDTLKTSDVRGLPKGRLYHVDIPESDTMLQWEKPLSEQPEAVKKALEDSGLIKEFNERKAPVGPRDEAGAGRGENFYLFLAHKLSAEKEVMTFDGPVKKMRPNEKAASLALLELGINGIKYKSDQIAKGGKGPAFNYVIFDDKAVKITSFEQAQKGEANAEYIPDLNAIKLNRNSNPSSYMHEFFHGALKHMHEFVLSGGADQEYLDHWKPMADFLDIKDEQKKLTVEQQERGARAWERYLRGEQDSENRAPSESLIGTFSLFRNWMAKTYRQIKGSPIEANVPVDVKNFFDRLLATDEEIAAAHAEAGYKPGEIADIPGMPEDARKNIRTIQERARSKAEETLLREQMAELRDENKSVLEKKRAGFAAAANDELRNLPIYQAMEDVRGEKIGAGGKIDGAGKAFGHDLTAPVIADRFLKNKLEPEQVSYFEAVAEIHGFADGADMARQMKDAPLLDDAIKASVEKSMLPFADLKNTDRIREAAMKAILTDRLTEVAFLEQKYLESMTKDKSLRDEINKRARFEAGVAAEAAKQQARDVLWSKPIKEATAYRSYVTAMKNAAVRVSKAVASGDMAAVARAKGEYGLNSALAAEAYRLREQVARDQRFLDKFINRGAELKDMPYGFVRQIDGLLSNFGLRAPADGSRATFLKIAREMLDKGEDSADIANATGFRVDERGALVPETLRDLVDRVNDQYMNFSMPESMLSGRERLSNELSPRDLSDLKSAIGALSDTGRKFSRFISLFLKGDIKEAAARFGAFVRSAVGANYEQNSEIGSRNATEFGDKIDRFTQLPDRVVPGLVNLLTVCEFLDGRDPDGPAKEYIYRPLKQAGDRKLARYHKMNAEINGIFSKYFKDGEFAKLKDSRVFFDFLKRERYVPTEETMRRMIKDGPLAAMQEAKDKGGRYLSQEEILMVAMNWGNEGNRDRIRRGFGINDEQVGKILDNVTHDGWKFTQEVWDYLNTYWPEIVKLETLVNGREPKKVESVPVATKYGAFRGGYFPISYDFTKSADAYRTAEQKNALYKVAGAAAAQTDNGHAQARVDSLKRPIRLSSDVIFNHLENIVHDLEYRPAIIDVSRFIAQQDTKTAITNALGVDGMRKITMELKDLASDQGEFLSMGEKALRWFRFNSTMATLGYRAFTVPMDMTGNTITAMQEIGPKRTFEMMKNFAMDPVKIKSFVDENSIRMKNRGMLRDRDIADVQKKWDGSESALKHFAFLFQSMADEALAYPMWNEVYQHSLEKYGHEKSVQIADESITKTFGSGARIDQVGMQKGGEFGKVLSMYYSWMSLQFNRGWLEGKMGGLQYDKGNTGAAIAIIAKAAFVTWGLQSVNENLWREMLRNGQQEDDKARNKRVLARTIEQPFGYVPVLRDLVNFTVDRGLGSQTASYKFSPLESAIESILKPIGTAGQIAFSDNKELDERFAESAARSAALLVGSPQKLNDLVFNFLDWMQDKGELTWRDFLTRRTKK